MALGRQPFVMSYTGYRIIFQKWFSITYEEHFKNWNRGVTGQSIPLLLQNNRQKLRTGLWTT